MKTDYDVVIIGGGPAGITSAIYLKRAGINVCILERLFLGGKIAENSVIDNYPGLYNIDGASFALKLSEHINHFDIPVIYDEIVKIQIGNEAKVIETKQNILKCKKIIIATGSVPRRLEVEGEKELIGRGISFCAVCDGMFFKDKNVAIIGAGNTAFESALALSKTSSIVYLLIRDKDITADTVLLEDAKKQKNIKIIYNTEILKILASDKKLVSQIVIKTKKDNGSENVDNNHDNIIEETLNVEGVFVNIGTKSNVDLFKNIVKLNEKNEIITDENMETNVSGIYAIGDVRDTRYRQIITAMSDGIYASLDIIKKLK